MASKYAKVLPNLKPLPNEDLDHQQRLDEVKQSIVQNADDSIDAATATELMRNLTHEACMQMASVYETALHAAPNQYASTLAHVYSLLRLTEEKLANSLKDVRLVLEAYEQLVVQQYEVECINNIKLDNGSSVRTEPQPYAKVIDREKFRQWCLRNGFEREMHLHTQTTQSITKQRLLDGQPEPDGVSAFVRTTVKFTA